MPSAPTTSFFPYVTIVRHVRDVLGAVSANKHRIASLLLGEPSAKRKSDGGEAKYVHRLDMVSVSSIVSPIEKADNRENGVTQTPKPQPQTLSAANLSLLPPRTDPRATTAQYIQAIPPPPCSSSWFDADDRIRSSSKVNIHHNPRDYAHCSCYSPLGPGTLEEECEADDEGKAVASGPTFFWSADDEWCVECNEMGEIESDSQGSTVEVDDGNMLQFAWICNRDFY